MCAAETKSKKSKKSDSAAAPVAAVSGSGDFVRGRPTPTATATADGAAGAAPAPKRHHLDSDVLFGSHKSFDSTRKAAAADKPQSKKDAFAALNEQKKALRKEKKERSKSANGRSSSGGPNKAAKFAETLSFRHLKPGMLVRHTFPSLPFTAPTVTPSFIRSMCLCLLLLCCWIDAGCDRSY